MIKIINDFLPKEYHEAIVNDMLSNNFPWYYNPRTLEEEGGVEPDDKFIFVHLFNNAVEVTSNWYPLINDMYKFIHKEQPFKQVYRCKANLSTNQGKAVKHGAHQDLHDVDDYITCVYQVNKNNGMTVFDDPDKGIYQEVPSEGNQLIIFSGNILHYGVTQTDKKARVVINFVMDNNES